MRYSGFIGQTYAGRSLTPAGDRTQNLYPERTDKAGAEGESQIILLGTPGHAVFTTLPLAPVQYIFEEPATKRLFVVSGAEFYEVLSNGAITDYGPVDPGYYQMASNAQQVMLSCAGAATGFIFNLGTNTLTKITSTGFQGSVSVDMIDNYFIVRNSLLSRQMQISAILDGTTWSAADVFSSEGGPDNLVGSIADHREYWAFGRKRFEVFVDTGATLQPFQRIESVAGQVGTLSAQSIVQLDNTIYWLGQSKEGQCRVFMNQSYNPIGVSTRAVEYFFNQYAAQNAVSNAVAYGYQDEDGHSFYVISFPSATVDLSTTGGVQTGVVNGATWVYDATEKMWHERPYLNPSTGKLGTDLGVYHAFAFNMQLVGGGDATGNIYQMSTNIYTSNGNPIARLRRAPHIIDELKWIKYKKARLNAQVGTGPAGDPFNYVSLRVSNDGGMTWSNYYQKSLGDAGAFSTVVEWRALGRSMRRAFELSTSIKSAVCFLDMYLVVEEGSH